MRLILAMLAALFSEAAVAQDRLLQPIGSWYFSDETRHDGLRPVFYCEILHGLRGWQISFLGAENRLRPIISHTHMRIPIARDQLLTMVLDGQPQRMQVDWIVYRRDGSSAFGMHPTEPRTFADRFLQARDVTVRVPGVETVRFRLSGTVPAMLMMNTCRRN